MITEKEIWDVINSPNFICDEERYDSYKCTIHKDGYGFHMNSVYGKTLFEAATHLVEKIKGEKYVPITDNGNSNEQMELLKETVIWDCIRSFKTKWVSQKVGYYEVRCFVNENNNSYISGNGETMFEAAKDLYKQIHEYK